MAIYVKVPLIYRKLLGGNSVLESKPGTVKNVLDDVMRRYPDLKKKILDKNGKLRDHINLYVNKKSINNLDAGLKDADELLNLL